MRFPSKLLDVVTTYDAVFLRLALGLTFLAAVTDRFGMWGPPGSPNVAWGDFERFAAYTATLNPWAPAKLVPAIVWIATIAETVLGWALILGVASRWSAFSSGVLLLLFALGMTFGTGVKSALNASVFSACAAAFMLSTRPVDPWTLDARRRSKRAPQVGSKQEADMAGNENVHAMLEIFRSIERRDAQRVKDLCHADVEFHWPPSLPYGGASRGRTDTGPTWSDTWLPLQPGEAEKRMDPRVVAYGDDEVVVLWRQRGINPAGDRFDGPVLGLYQLRERKLARAQMFYFDTAALVGFLAKASGRPAT